MILFLLLNLASASYLDEKCTAKIVNICGKKTLDPKKKASEEDKKIMICRLRELSKCIVKDKNDS